MLGPKGHGFWWNYCKLMQRRIDNWWWIRKSSQLTTIVRTGPLCEEHAFQCLKHKYEIVVLDDTELFSLPQNWSSQCYGVDFLASGYGKWRYIGTDILLCGFLLLLIILLCVIVWQGVVHACT